jgi:predicted RNase H-like nuclease (RuvC/YqgF family)
MVKKIVIIGFALILGVVVLPHLTLAQSSAALESRISRLEADNFQMRSQINRLESQLSGLSGHSLSPNPSLANSAPSVPPRANRQVSSSDPMFDRLATLVIELKERVKALETQVSQLQRR